MSSFQCARCGQLEPRLPSPPMPGPLGIRLMDGVCGSCWQEWLRHQTALINHYALNLRDPQAKQLLLDQLETFLFAPKPSAS